MEKVFEALETLKNRALSDLDSIPKTAIPMCEKSNEEVMKTYKIINQALTELKAIKEAKPNEALKCLYKVASKVELADCDDYWEVRNAYAKVEQYLQKAQEQEKEFDDNFNFKEIGHTMVGFDYKGTQVIAMPLEEYDDFMEQEKALDTIREKLVWVENGKLMCGRYADIEIELEEDDFENKEEFDTLKRLMSDDKSN